MLSVACLLAVRGSGIFDPCASHRGRGRAVQPAPLLPCNDRNDSSRGILSPMRAKTSDQGARQARRAERSSRSSTRTATGSKRQAEPRLHDYPKLIDILFNSFTCDAVPGLFGSCRTCSARLIPTEQIFMAEKSIEEKVKDI